MRTCLLPALFLLDLCMSLRAAPPAAQAAALPDSPRDEMAAAIKHVEVIINQRVTAHGRTPGMRVQIYPGWFHPGATRPDFDNVDVRTTRETPYDPYEYVCSDASLQLVYVGRELEFNSMTKYFYKDRTVPKKKLTDAEMVEINRLYRIIGRCQRQLAQSHDSASSPASSPDTSDSSSATPPTTRLLNPYTGGAIALALVLALILISKRRGQRTSTRK